MSTPHESEQSLQYPHSESGSSQMQYTVNHAMRMAWQALGAAGVDSPEADTRALAAYVLGIDSSQLFFHHDHPMPEEFFTLFERRCQRVPLQHILGSAPFAHLDIPVGPGVFIPRPETEVLAQWGLEQLQKMAEQHRQYQQHRQHRQKKAQGSSGESSGTTDISDIAPGDFSPVVVDLCTGSGALAAYIATQMPTARVYAVELDPTTCQWTQKTCELYAPQITLVQADATAETTLQELNGQVDLLLTNPPYVPTSTEVSPEVQADPYHAVFAGEDGMATILPLLGTITRLLRPGGVFGIEHDDATSQAVYSACEQRSELGEIRPLEDLAGIRRFVCGSKL